MNVRTNLNLRNRLNRAFNTLLLLLSMLIPATSIISQVNTSDRIFTLDAVSKKAIPYVTLRATNGSFGIYSNENGEFDKSILIDREVELSSIGYISKMIKISKQSKYVYLEPKDYNIAEITVKPKKYKTIRTGYLKYNQLKSLHISDKCGSEFAVFIKNPTGESAIIKRVLFDVSLHRKHKRNRYNFISVFRINVYSVKEGFQVGELINTSPLNFTSKELNPTTKLDIGNYSIEMPPEGAFIGIEWLGKLNESTQDIELIDHSIEPFIGFTSKLKGTQVYKRDILLDNKWEKFDENSWLIKMAGTGQYIPKISVDLVY